MFISKFSCSPASGLAPAAYAYPRCTELSLRSHRASVEHASRALWRPAPLQRRVLQQQNLPNWAARRQNFSTSAYVNHHWLLLLFRPDLKHEAFAYMRRSRLLETSLSCWSDSVPMLGYSSAESPSPSISKEEWEGSVFQATSATLGKKPAHLLE